MAYSFCEESDYFRGKIAQIMNRAIAYFPYGKMKRTCFISNYFLAEKEDC